MARGNSLQEAGEKHPLEVHGRENLFCLPKHMIVPATSQPQTHFCQGLRLGLELQNAGLFSFCSLGKRFGPILGSWLDLLLWPSPPSISSPSPPEGDSYCVRPGRPPRLENARLRGRQSEPGNVERRRLGGPVTQILLPVPLPPIPRH